jgi:hypothetical protein
LARSVAKAMKDRTVCCRFATDPAGHEHPKGDHAHRVMARDVIDAALADFGKWVPASVTDQLPLLGANGQPRRQNSTSSSSRPTPGR